MMAKAMTIGCYGRVGNEVRAGMRPFSCCNRIPVFRACTPEGGAEVLRAKLKEDPPMKTRFLRMSCACRFRWRSSWPHRSRARPCSRIATKRRTSRPTRRSRRRRAETRQRARQPRRVTQRRSKTATRSRAKRPARAPRVRRSCTASVSGIRSCQRRPPPRRRPRRAQPRHADTRVHRVAASGRIAAEERAKSSSARRASRNHADARGRARIPLFFRVEVADNSSFGRAADS